MPPPLPPPPSPPPSGPPTPPPSPPPPSPPPYPPPSPPPPSPPPPMPPPSPPPPLNPGATLKPIISFSMSLIGLSTFDEAQASDLQAKLATFLSITNPNDVQITLGSSRRRRQLESAAVALSAEEEKRTPETSVRLNGEAITRGRRQLHLTTVSTTSHISSDYKFHGATITSNGLIVFAPQNAQCVGGNALPNFRPRLPASVHACQHDLICTSCSRISAPVFQSTTRQVVRSIAPLSPRVSSAATANLLALPR